MKLSKNRVLEKENYLTLSLKSQVNETYKKKYS